MAQSRRSPDPKRLRTTYAACRPQYSKVLRQTQREVQSVLSREGAPFTIKSRVKSFESYFEKVLRLRAREELVPITDMLGLRIVCPFLDDIERQLLDRLQHRRGKRPAPRQEQRTLFEL